MVESASTFRQDVVADTLAFLNTFASSNPTLLARAYPQRPESFADLPCAFIDIRSELVTFDSGLWNRQMDMGFVLVDKLTSNAETVARMDVVVDAMCQALNDAVGRLTTFSVFSRFTYTDVSEAIGDYQFAAVRFAFPDLAIQGGHT